MKKLLISALVLVMCVSIFASCTFGKEPENPDNIPDDPVTENPDNDGQKPNDQKPNTPTDNTVWANGIQINVIAESALESSRSFDTDALTNAILANTSLSPLVYFGEGAPEKGKNEIVIGNTERAISTTAYNRLSDYLYIDGIDDYSGWMIYAEDGSLALAYDTNLAMVNAVKHLCTLLDSESSFKPQNGIVASDRFYYDEKIDEIRSEERDSDFAALEKILDKNTVDALRKLYTLYTDDVYVWMANLYDPTAGGFYFSNSGRDNIGFGADIESTAQILNHLETAGLFDEFGGKYAAALPDEIKNAILGFAKGLQSADDGYFYHPQWGKNIITARRSRDLQWATGIITKLGAKPFYDAPDGTAGELGAPGQNAPASALTERLGSSLYLSVAKATAATRASTSSLPSYLKSIDAWKAYIAKLDIPNNSYSAGNTLAAQYGQIINAGQEYVDYLVEYLNSTQNPETGLWEEGVTDDTVNGLMKLASCYNYFKATIPNADKALESAVKVLLNPDGDSHVCCVYNPWVCMEVILASVSRSEGAEAAGKLRQGLIAQAAALIDITATKLSDYYVNGGFHYHSTNISHMSQQAPVACATEFEADVNATSICTTGITRNIFAVLGVEYVDLYCSEDYYRFIDIISNLGEVIKNEPKPVDPVTFDTFEYNDGQHEFGVIKYPAGNSEVLIPDKVLNNEGEYKYYDADVLDDPKPDSVGDLALNMKNHVFITENGSKDYASSMFSSTFKIENLYVLGNTYILNTDIMVEHSDNAVAAQIFLTASSSGFSLNLTVYEKEVEVTDPNGNVTKEKRQFVRLWDNFVGADGEKNMSLAEGMPVGEWFNLKIELYKIYQAPEDGMTSRALDVIAKIFVNGEFVGISEAFTTAKEDPSKFADSSVTMFKFASYRYTDSSIWLDNVKVERSAKLYKHEQVEVDPEDIPESVPTPEGMAEGGAYFNSAASTGKKYDFNSLVIAPALSNGNSAKTYIHSVTDADGAINSMIYFWRTAGGKESGHESTLHTYGAPMEKPENMVIVGELDLAFGNLPAATDNVHCMVLAGGGYSGSVYMSTDENGNITFRNTLGTGTSPVLKQNTWYNVRYEAYLVSELAMNIKIYINGQYAVDLGALDFRASTEHSIKNQMQYTLTESSFMLYDNLFVGYDSLEYVWPEGVKPPETTEVTLPDGTHGGGVLFNDTKNSGKRYDLSEASQLQIMLNSRGLASTAVTMRLDGAAMYKRTDTLMDDNVYYLIGSNSATLTVAEFDIAYSNIEGAKAAYIKFYTGSGLGRGHQINVGLKDGALWFGDNDKYIHTAEGYTAPVQNKWYNMRFELYTLKTGKTAAKVYIDGAYSFTVETTSDKRTNEARVVFQLYRPYEATTMFVDNIYLGDHAKSYTVGETGLPEPDVETPDTPDVPEDVTLPEGTHGGGVLYNDTSVTGKRYGFESPSEMYTMLNSSGSASTATSEIIDGAVKYTRTDTLTNDNALYKNASGDETVSVVEFDIAFTDLGGANSMFFKFYSGKTLGKTHQINVGLKNGAIWFGSSDSYIHQAEDYVAPVEGKWYNLKFELYILADDTFVAKIFINGSYALTVNATKGSNTNQGRVLFQLNKAFASSSIMIDNIYLGDHGKSYVEAGKAPPEENPGTGEDTSSSRGHGVYYNDANKAGKRWNMEDSTLSENYSE